jgi:predicted O-methyltransferase YrrM
MLLHGLSIRMRRALKRALRRRPFPEIVVSVHRESLSYLDEEALDDLYQSVATLEREQRGGILIEAGCALGGSAIVIAAAKAAQRPFFIYDVFGMPPPPSPGDGPEVHARYRIVAAGESPGIDGNQYYGYVEDVLDKVLSSFRRHGLEPHEKHVEFVRGMMQETLTGDEPVAFAHVDCDRYESVMTVLQRVAPRMTQGGVMVIDDYDTWSGCRKAVDEYFRDRRDAYRFVRRSRLHVIRR